MKRIVEQLLLTARRKQIEADLVKSTKATREYCRGTVDALELVLKRYKKGEEHEKVIA